MALFVDKKRTYVRTVTDPEDKETYTVTLKKMSEGDFQQRQDLATKVRLAERKKGRKGRKGKRSSGGSAMEYAMGQIRLFDLSRSIVDWSFTDETGEKVPPSETFIGMLDPGIAEQIHDHVEELNPFIFRDEEDDGDEEEDDGDEDGDDARSLRAVASLGDSPGEQEFGEGEGPTGSAATS